MRDPYLDALEQLDQMRDRAFEAEATIQRVRELHREVEGPGFTYCKHCDRIGGGIFGTCEWPCETIRALDGDA